METIAQRFGVLDGYRLIRFLGQGGFGEVWLCRSESMGDFRALKFIPTSHADRLDKEYDALLHFRNAASRLRSPHLVSIEHVGHNDAGLYYVMPLADGGGAGDPSDAAWVPLSLASLIRDRADSPAWFSSGEIISLILPVLGALQTLSDAGLVHRDVKPDNILFFDGHPCLGDISLLGADASMITRRGTHGYVTPSWYMGGHPDMYAAAATLFNLLTGNAPDMMGRSAFMWPPQGEASLSQAERVEWKRLHGVIRRATEEKVAERYVDFRAMAAALSETPGKASPPVPAPAPKRGSKPLLYLVVAVVTIAVMFALMPDRESTGRTPDKPAIADTAPREHVGEVKPPASTGRAPKVVDAGGNFTPVRQKVIKAIPAAIETDSDDTVLSLDPTNYSGQHDIPDAYERKDYRTCLELMEAEIGRHPSLLRNPLCLLLKALLLRHLDRKDEMAAVLGEFRNLPTTPPYYQHAVEGQLDLMEALALHDDAETFVSKVIGVALAGTDLSNPQVSGGEILGLVQLYNRRARVKILKGDMAGALADERLALALPHGVWQGISESAEKTAQSHLNTIVMQWELLEQEFPAYDRYLAERGSPEPQPDRRNLDAED